jgi:hypothetical protein
MYRLELQSRTTGQWRQREYPDYRTAVGALLAQTWLEPTKRVRSHIRALMRTSGSYTASAPRFSPYGMVRLVRYDAARPAKVAA